MKIRKLLFLLPIFIALIIILEGLIYFQKYQKTKPKAGIKASQLKHNPIFEEKTRLAKKVLKDKYALYDENSLGREFGVYKIGNNTMVTGVVIKINSKSITLDCGSFQYISLIDENLPVFMIDGSPNNDCAKTKENYRDCNDGQVKPAQKTIKAISKNDLVSLMMGGDIDVLNNNLVKKPILVYKYFISK